MKARCLGAALLLSLTLMAPAAAEPPAGGATRYEQGYYRDEAYLDAYRRAVRYYNSALADDEVERIVTALLHYSAYYHLDPRLVTALVACESRFRPTAVSSAGARGLGQLMPDTAKSEGVNPDTVTDNIHGACRVLRRNLNRYTEHGAEQQLTLALAAYNAGPGAVEKYGGVPPYAETTEYIRRVLAEYRRLCGQ